MTKATESVTPKANTVSDEPLQGKLVVIRGEGPKSGPGMPEMLTPTRAIMGTGLGIRDSLRCLEEEMPVLRLRRLLKEAIADERFQDAASFRDELKEIAPHSLLKCSSDATTLGMRVQVRSMYIEGRSQSAKELYFFAYRIRITNNSNRPVQLLRRHWIITDANGKTENIWELGLLVTSQLYFLGLVLNSLPHAH